MHCFVTETHKSNSDKVDRLLSVKTVITDLCSYIFVAINNLFCLYEVVSVA